MTPKQISLLIFTITGIAGYLTATLNLLPQTTTFYLQIFSATLALLTIGYGAIKNLIEHTLSMDFLASIAI
jgi:hypothetical protein